MYTPESSDDFMILVTLSISSFEINKVNLFSTPRALFPLIFIPDLFITFEV